jgi:hypothetical protein
MADRVGALIRLYGSTNPRVKVWAMRVMLTYYCGDPRINPCLLDFITRGPDCWNDPDLREIIRWAPNTAVDCLGRSGDPALVEPMLRLVAGKSAGQRVSACEVLGALGDARALPDLLRAATADESSLVRREATVASGRIGDPRPAAALRDRYDAGPPEDDLDLRFQQWVALRAMGTQPDRKPWERPESQGPVTPGGPPAPHGNS